MAHNEMDRGHRLHTRSPSRLLLEVLVRQGALPPEDEAPLAEAARTTGQTVCTLLLALRAVDEEILAQTFVDVCNLPYLDVTTFTVDKDILNAVGPDVCWRRRIIPLDRIGDTITLAMVDPLDDMVAGRVRADTRCAVTRVVARAGEMTQALARHFPGQKGPDADFGADEAARAVDDARTRLARAGVPVAAAESDQATDTSLALALGWLGGAVDVPGRASPAAAQSEPEDLPSWLDDAEPVKTAPAAPPPARAAPSPAPPVKSPKVTPKAKPQSRRFAKKAGRSKAGASASKKKKKKKKKKP